MINFSDLKVGDYVIADNDGDSRRGEITDLNRNDKQVCIHNGTQNFWYEINQVIPLPLNDEEMQRLKFHKEQNDDGTVKYLKGAFRLMIPKEGDFSKMEIWYRDEARHIQQSINVHTLQNHFYEMTKVYLTEASFD